MVNLLAGRRGRIATQKESGLSLQAFIRAFRNKTLPQIFTKQRIVTGSRKGFQEAPKRELYSVRKQREQGFQ